MDEATYASIPEKLVLREIRFQVVEPGRRTRKLTIITTLTNPETYTAEDITKLYGSVGTRRAFSELTSGHSGRSC
jgi:hypothetical protein